jgi:FKBP-type peptidyl-prolyl cis-trans isomerase (trigger factor)
MSPFNEAEYREQNRESALFGVKSILLKVKIIKVEKLDVDDVDLSIYAEKEAARLGMDKEKILGYIKTSEQIKYSILENKFLDFIKGNNRIVEIDMNEQIKNDLKIITP